MQVQFNPDPNSRESLIKSLEKQIADLKSRWPAHSVPPTMVQELDELEEELERARGSSLRGQ